MEEHHHNGSGIASNPVASEWGKLEAAYRELNRRDGSAEQRAFRWMIMAWVGMGLLGCFVIRDGIYRLTAAPVQALVQLVQVDDAGRLIQLGFPQDVLAYTPDDRQWMIMLREWVENLRWQSTDPVLMKANRRWVYGHTCAGARQVLPSVRAFDEMDKPYLLGKKQVSIHFASFTKTPAPMSFHVIWKERVTEIGKSPQETQWTGTFTVGRMKPGSQEAQNLNPLGLCVKAFNISQQPT